MNCKKWIEERTSDKIASSSGFGCDNEMDNEYLDRYRTLGLNIAYYRKKKGYTQEQLAEKAGVDRSRISKTEIAWVGTSLDIVYRIADALEIEPHKLFVERE